MHSDSPMALPNGVWMSILFHLSFVLLLCPSSNNCQYLFEYFPSSPESISDVLKTTLSEEDFIHSKVKILPDDQDIVFQLRYAQRLKMVYPIPKKGPISIAVSPCTGALKWTLVWRPHSHGDFDVVQADAAATEAEKVTSGPKNSSSTDDQFYDFNIKKTKKKKYFSSEEPYNSDKELWPQFTRVKRSKMKRDRYGSRIISNNFSIPLDKNPSMRYVFNRNRAILQVQLSQGSGKEPWLFENESVQPGLYILQIEAMSHLSKFHALASRHPLLQEDVESNLKALKPKENSVKHSITLAWTSSSHEAKLYCLAISQEKLYSSLCAARELQQQWRLKSTPASDTSMILGCTSNSYYNFPATPHSKYFVTVWKDSSVIPLVQATVKAKPHRKIPRLRPGVMVHFTLTAGGHAVAKFNVRKAGKKLHVAAVSCYGGVKVLVLAGKERVASARGREALHLTVRRPPKAKLTIKVSPEPPLQALYRVHVVASHSARRLPIPRLPKNVTVQSTPLNCTSAKVEWTKSSGGPSYCVVFQRHPSGRPPEIRPPIQCGWEHVIKRRDYFEAAECFNSTKNSSGRVQHRIVSNLTPDSSFLVNVLVKHPRTGRILALATSMLSLPPC